MMQWTLNDIVRATNGRLLYGSQVQCFGSIGIDSRCVNAEMLFVAIRGQNHDGHTFVQEVVDRGVTGIVIQQDHPGALDHENWKSNGVACVAVSDTTHALGALAAFQRQRANIPVVAITGSNGKTTARQMTTQVMARRYHTLATQGNLNNEIGVPLTLFNLTAQHEAAVVELGMNHLGEIDRLAAICQPTIGVILNAGPAHLEFLGTVAQVAQAKGELLAHIDPEGVAILNKDDSLVAALADETRANVLFFGTHAHARVRGEDIRVRPGGVDFQLCLPDEKTKVHVHTAGRFMVSNALAAAAVGHAAGLSPQEIKGGLEAFRPVDGRLTIRELANGVHLIDDTYNANPASMAAAFDTLQSLKGKGRSFAVLGDMLELGAQAEALHHHVGQMAARAGTEKLYACGEYAHHVLAGAGEAGMAGPQLVTGSKSDIAADLLHHVQPGDWVLVKGSRGMAMETVVAAVTHCLGVSNEPSQRKQEENTEP